MRARLQYKYGVSILYHSFGILFGLKIEGVSNVPKNGRVILACNHRSNYDPPLVGCCIHTRPIYYFAKKCLFNSRFSSEFLKSLNAIPVDTENLSVKTMKKFINLLKEGEALMVFPEGTRSKTNEFLEAQPGVGYLSLKTNTMVLPVFIKGTHEPMIRHFFRRSPLLVKFGKPIYPYFKKVSKENARAFSNLILEEIKKLA